MYGKYFFFSLYGISCPTQNLFLNHTCNLSTQCLLVRSTGLGFCSAVVFFCGIFCCCFSTFWHFIKTRKITSFNTKEKLFCKNNSSFTCPIKLKFYTLKHNLGIWQHVWKEKQHFLLFFFTFFWVYHHTS